MVHLKQDALCLFNLAIAGCACGALVDLFEAAYGYPESAEAKHRAKEFKSWSISSRIKMKSGS